MSYKLDYLAVLKAYIYPLDLITLIVTIIVLSILVPYIYKLIKAGLTKKNLVNISAIIIIIFSIILIPPTLNSGAGWVLDGDTLLLNARPVSVPIKLSKTTMMFVDYYGDWQPTLRTSGYGTTGLSTGWFKLKNGEKAVVFRHMYSNKALILKTEERYYLISHPQIELLYQSLLERGVRSNES